MTEFGRSTQALFDALGSKDGASAEVVRQLIEDGADLRALDSYGMTPLIRYLSDRGVMRMGAWNAYRACLRSWDTEGKARAAIESLLARVQRQGWEIVAMMLAHGADANATWDSDSALHIAVQHHPDPREIRLILAAGANVSARNKAGATPLLHASLTGNPDVIRLLLEAGSDPLAATSAGETALHFAWEPHTVRSLIDAGADVNARDANRFTPLSSALSERSSESIRLLMSAGSDPLAVGAFDRTALHCAAIDAACAEVFAALIEGGVDTRRKEAGGHTALDIVRRLPDYYESVEEHAKIVRLLEHATRE